MIQVNKLNKTYDRRSLHANHVLKDVTVTLPDKGFVCILGPSGCGKTSLLNAIGGLDAFDNGTLSTENVSVSRYGTAAFENERNRSFGYIFQNYYLLENHSVAYNVYLGLHSLELSHRQKLGRVRQALEAVDMQRYARRLVGELSGGQQQRVAIARALARRPRVIFADEPTGNLDEANTHNICSLLRRASRDSLVLMVTHEERIARFYADRIITLEEGTVASDETGWDREHMDLGSDKTLYTGDFADSSAGLGQLSIRLLQRQDAAPVELTVVAMKDRIVLKLSDSRTVLLSQGDEVPAIVEGARPVLKLEAVEQTDNARLALFDQPPAGQVRAGKGVSFSMMVREAGSLLSGKGIRSIGMRIFLMLLTVLTMLTVGDFIAVSRIAPEDYVNCDSHVLQVWVEKGMLASQEDRFSDDLEKQYFAYIKEKLPQCTFLGQDIAAPAFQASIVYQMEDITLRFPAHSTVPLEMLSEADLLYGRMPEHSGEIVVDRLVLEKVLKNDGIIQNVVTDVQMFLNEPLSYGKRTLHPVIVGISDSGEQSVYMSKAAMLALSYRGASVIGLSEFLRLHPEYEGLVLRERECIAIKDNAGEIYRQRIDTYANVSAYRSYLVKDAVNSQKTLAYFVIPDADIDDFLFDVATEKLELYCPDRESAKAAILEGSSWEEERQLQVTVEDRYGQQYSTYLSQTRLRTDARVIVTVTVVVICMVMLYLLCRARIHDRLSLVAVYRLLGIPGGKLYGIFVLESLASSVSSVLPCGLLTWAVIAALRRFTEIPVSMELPWQAAVAVCGGIMVYYLAVALLPLGKLLRLPPARLAAQYDI